MSVGVAIAADDDLPIGWIRLLILATLATLCALAVTAVEWPILDTEPIYAAVNVTVTVLMMTVGSYMVLYRREQFTGLCFALAGMSWPLIVMDIYGGWGPFVSFVFGAGSTFFVPIVWGTFRYGRPRLSHWAERFYLAYNAFFTSGVGVVFSMVTEPEWLGYPPQSSWPSLWPDPQAFAIIGALLLFGFLSASVLFTTLALRMLRIAPPLRREAIRPLCYFGIVLGFGATFAYAVASFTDELSFHAMTIVIGALAICLTAGLGFAMVRQDLLRGAALDTIPAALDPSAVTGYLRTALRDPTADLWFVDPRTDLLLDGSGRVVDAPVDGAFSHWILDTDGARIALLTADPTLADDEQTVKSVGRVLTVLADNARLQVLLELRVVELGAARTAESLAYQHAHASFQRDLHDGVQQTLAAARMDLEGMLEDSAAETAMATGGVALQQKLALAQEQVRGIKTRTGPPELRLGLDAAISRVISDLRLDAKITVTGRDLGVMTLPAYYVVRESLLNVHKHAKASTVTIAVDTDGRKITVTVTDDGIGGAVSCERSGITGMRMRVEELGGTLDVHSPPGAGTSVRARLPHVGMASGMAVRGPESEPMSEPGRVECL